MRQPYLPIVYSGRHMDVVTGKQSVWSSGPLSLILLFNYFNYGIDLNGHDLPRLIGVLFFLFTL